MLAELLFKENNTPGMSEVEEVLHHAKDALARHHAWMSRRQNQRAVAPMRALENSPVDTAAEVQPTSWAVGTFSSERGRPLSLSTMQCDYNRVYFPAPPSSEIPAAAPTSKKKAKFNSNQIAPSVEWSPDSLDVNRERNGLSPNLKPIFISPLKEDKGDTEGIHLSEGRHELPLPLETASVNKLISSGHLSDDILEVEFNGGQDGVEVDPNASPPPYVMSVTAWGEDGGNVNTSGLASHRVSTTEREMKKERNVVSSAKNNNRLLHRRNTPPTATPMLSLSGTTKHQTVVLPTSPSLEHADDPYQKMNVGEEEESLDSSDDYYRTLQESNSTRLMTVSPAPKNQRASFSAHTESKLGQVDARSNAYDYSLNCRYEEEDNFKMGSELVPQSDSCQSGASVRDAYVPDSNIQMVRPAREGKGSEVRVTKAGDPSRASEADRKFQSDTQLSGDDNLSQINTNHRSLANTDHRSPLNTDHRSLANTDHRSPLNTDHRSPAGAVGQDIGGRIDEDLTVMDLEDNGVWGEKDGVSLAVYDSRQEKNDVVRDRRSGSQRFERPQARSSGGGLEERRKKTRKAAHEDGGSTSGGVRSVHQSLDKHRRDREGELKGGEDNACATVATGDSITASVPNHAAMMPEQIQSSRVAETNHSSGRSPTPFQPPLKARASRNENPSLSKHTLPPLKLLATVANRDENTSPSVLPPLKPRATVANGDENSSVVVPPNSVHRANVYVGKSLFKVVLLLLLLLLLWCCCSINTHACGTCVNVADR